MKADQIPHSTNQNVEYLRRYLDFADRETVALAGARDFDSTAMPESAFEESVLEVIRKWGYDAQPQVGTAGYRIDIGIRDPYRPGK